MGGSGMRVAVVGAGIAGLTLAAALARAGIRADVYEQAAELREVGAGIQLSPNATRLLRRMGLSHYLQQVAVRPELIEMRRWDSGEVLMRSVLGAECEAMYGAPYYAVHRADLHRGLLDCVPPGQLHLDRPCRRVSERADAVEVQFGTGDSIEADVVVGADGIHSTVRRLLAADEPRFSGQTVYRGLVPGDALPELVAAPRVSIWLGPGQHCVHYPISGGKLVSFVATAPATAWRGESWTAQANADSMRAAYATWHEQVTSVLAAADTVTHWALHDRDPIRCWSTDRVTLVGDAAHPMLPFGAQGAAQAVEDALALAACLRQVATANGGSPVAAVAQALRRYEQVRRSRTERVQLTMRENARNHHFVDGAQQRQRDRTMNRNWSLPGQAWLYDYDAEYEVTLQADGGSNDDS